MGFLKLNRFARELSTLMVTCAVLVGQICADDRISISPDSKIRKTTAQDSPLASDLKLNFLKTPRDFLASRIEMPPRPRISRSRLPLRQIDLIGGEHFVAECLDWGSKSVTFRLLDGQTIHLPRESVSAMQNPPGEIDLIDESFEIDQIERSQRSTDHDSKYQQEFSPPSCARLELTFLTSIINSAASGGEWQFDWSLNQVQQPPMIVRINSDRRVTVSGLSTANEAFSQSLMVSEGHHSLIALFTPDRIQLILDDATLASFAAKGAAVRSIQIRPPEVASKNVLRVEDFHARRLISSVAPSPLNQLPRDTDSILLSSGDELFGRLIGLNRKEATIESFGERRNLPWREISGLNWQQPEVPISQKVSPKTGIVAHIELQPFVDRPECDAERWTVTVVEVDATQLRVQHSLAGDMVFRWSEIRRLNPLYFGQSIVVDARQFHLGDAIRPDLHRQMPDGPDLRVDFQLNEIPAGKSYLSFNLAELEAASPDSPPASPFLADLRAGRLLTELYVNQQKTGSVNALVRYKANARHPDRIRMEIPLSLLKPGNNSFRLRQLPLKQGGREYDDCELGDIRLEFDIR